MPDASNAVLVPPDHLLLARGNGLVVFPFDVAAFRVTGDPAVVANDVLGSRSNGYGAFSVSGEGTLVSATGQAVVSSSLWWYDRAGHGRPRRLLVAAEDSVKTEPLRVVLDWPADIAGR